MTQGRESITRVLKPKWDVKVVRPWDMLITAAAVKSSCDKFLILVSHVLSKWQCLLISEMKK